MMLSLFRLPKKVDFLVQIIGNTQARILSMSKELEDLRAAVAENAAVTESAVALIEGIADRISAAIEAADADESNEPLEALAEEIRSQSRALADAVAANTQAGGTNPQSGAEGSAGGPGDSPVADKPPAQS